MQAACQEVAATAGKPLNSQPQRQRKHSRSGDDVVGNGAGPYGRSTEV